jgi:hypothetical protein
MAGSKSGPDADAVLADALGAVVARMQLRQQWQRELDLIKAEGRAAVAEVKAACLEIVLEERASPESVARLRAIGGRR